MMIDTRSIYSLNKADPDSIVYKDAEGNVIRLTRDDFASEEDFCRWKEISDEDFHVEEKADHIYFNHTVCFDDALGVDLSEPSTEIVLEQRFTKRRNQEIAEEAVVRIKGKLTEKQYRRLWMYAVQNMTEAQISVVEHVGQPRISKSIQAAIKKSKKILVALKNRG